MLKIKIIAPGKTKEQNFLELEKRFQTLLSPYASINWQYTKEFALQKGENQSAVQIREGEEILKKIDENTFTIVLDENGKQLTSHEFAGQIAKVEELGGAMQIIIGGAFGLSEDVKSKADLLLGLSKMTITHGMVRTFILEQIYRGICINKGKKYHW